MEPSSSRGYNSGMRTRHESSPLPWLLAIFAVAVLFALLYGWQPLLFSVGTGLLALGALIAAGIADRSLAHWLSGRLSAGL